MILPVKTATGGYEIVLERGCLQRAEQYLDLRRRVLIVTDARVPAAYAEAIAAKSAAPLLRRLPSGEGSKSLRVMEELLTDMLRSGFTRSDCVCAVGGGVPGDLAGFTAACYMRGIPFYNIPTTLLSQVDSSIGGKTAVNLDGIKNPVGAFYPPARVLIDADTLSSLSPRLLAEGMAEAVKAGLIGDAALFALFESGAAAAQLDEVIRASLEVKRRVVEEDEADRGLRRILNFGHTIGHGIESVTGLYHGECVALGMLPMCAPALRERLLPVLERLGLPTSVRADPERVYAAVLHDKKIVDGTLTVVRTEEPGSFTLEEMEPAALRPLIETVVRP